MLVFDQFTRFLKAEAASSTKFGRRQSFPQDSWPDSAINGPGR
jgi:hypothetical protein